MRNTLRRGSISIFEPALSEGGLEGGRLDSGTGEAQRRRGRGAMSQGASVSCSVACNRIQTGTCTGDVLCLVFHVATAIDRVFETFSRVVHVHRSSLALGWERSTLKKVARLGHF